MTLDEYNHFLLNWWCFDPFEYDYWDHIPVSRTTGRACMLMIPEGLTSIEESSFENCGFISSVRIPGTAEIIESQAFFRCDALEEVIFSEGISYIYEKAFSYLKSLTTLSLPDSLKYIGNTVFSECKKLESVTLSGNRPLLQEDDAFNLDTFSFSEYLFYIKNGKQHHHRHVNGTTFIENNVFEKCPNLKRIIIQDCVTFTRATPFTAEDVKYASVFGSYLKSRNPVSEEYIRRNTVLIFWFLIECGDMDMIRRFLDLHEFITSENIDELIGCSLSMTDTTNAAEIRAMLLHYKSEVLGYEDSKKMFDL